MRKTHDYGHRYEDHDNNSGFCRIRVYAGGVGRPIVVVTELPKNKGAYRHVRRVPDSGRLIASQ
jgi:hypothetical protein